MRKQFKEDCDAKDDFTKDNGNRRFYIDMLEMIEKKDAKMRKDVLEPVLAKLKAAAPSAKGMFYLAPSLFL
jgi:hypothetical protein